MKDSIKRIVAYYIKRFGSRNPFELANFLGIEYTIGPLGTPYGCYMYIKKHRCIFLNNNLSDNDKRLVMAHELGHALLHRTENCYFIRNKTLLSLDKIERQANQFAAELLIPDDLIYRYEGFTRRQIAYAEGLNEELLRLKFEK